MRASLLILLACTILTACSDATGGGGGPAGTYALATVNGAPLPFTYYQSPPSPVYTNQTVSGSLTLKSNQTFVIRLTAHLAKDGAVYNVIADSAGGFRAHRERGGVHVHLAPWRVAHRHPLRPHPHHGRRGKRLQLQQVVRSRSRKAPLGRSRDAFLRDHCLERRRPRPPASGRRAGGEERGDGGARRGRPRKAS